MERLTGTVKLSISIERFHKLNTLIDRDRAMAVTTEKYNAFVMDYCPVCGIGLVKECRFCHNCGQRVDSSLEAF